MKEYILSNNNFYFQPLEKYDLEDMKHTVTDEKILKARKTSLEAADTRRNRIGNPEILTSNIINVQQQACVNGQEVNNDPAKNSARNSGNLKLPGTSVRHMQQKSRSMTDGNVAEKIERNKENLINGSSKQEMIQCRSGTVERSESNSPVPRFVKYPRCKSIKDYQTSDNCQSLYLAF